MYKLVWLVSYTALIIVSAKLAVEAFNITEPGRQTKIFGRDFFVVISLKAGQPENGSFFQIACVSCGSSPAKGSITLLWGNFSESFSAGPTASVSLSISALEPLTNKTTPAIFNVTADADITVAVVINIGGSLSAFTAIPSASLDMYYLVASYGLNDIYSELTVVAHKKGTSVTFCPNSKNVTVSESGNDLSPSLVVELNIGEWVEYQTAEYFMGGHLKASNPVSGIVNTRCKSRRKGCPRSAEQLYPLVSLGTTYTAVPLLQGNLSNVFRAVAVWNTTTIAWSSGSHSQGDYRNGSCTLNNSQVLDLPSVNMDMYIRGSKPFLLLHHIEQGTPAVDTAIVTVPPVEQFTHHTLTFSTYRNVDPMVSNFISITAPCKYIDDIVLMRDITGPSSVLGTGTITASGGEYCGSSRRIEHGTYTIGPTPDTPDSPDAVYSAILYGRTEQGVFAYILATDLNQVTCSVDETQEVHLCPPKVPILPPLTTVTTSAMTVGTSTEPDKEKSISDGTIAAVVVVVFSIIAGCAVMGICLYRYFKRRRWRRLDESDYLEDNPIRMQVLDSGCRL